MEITIIVSGGIVTAVFANGQSINVTVIDRDNYATDSEADAVVDAALVNTPHDIF